MINSYQTPRSVVYLSRRNLLTLLSKLDRAASGDETACSIIKSDNTHEKYPQSMDSIMVCAVEDAEYYGTSNRAAGDIHPADESVIAKGIRYSNV